LDRRMCMPKGHTVRVYIERYDYRYS
jgi:hypothetical protein